MNKRNRDGFSMIEVMVAAAIMVVLVMMLGMLFQQTSVAWRTGLMRSDGYMQLRTFIGALQRDASEMIDANWLPANLLCRGQKQEFDSTKIQFYTMTGSAEDFRTLSFITYDIDEGSRTQRRLKPDGTWDTTSTSLLEVQDGVGASLDKPQVRATRFYITHRSGTENGPDGQAIDNAQNRYPLFLTVATEVTQHGRLYDVGVECSGPDKVFGASPSDAAYKDDIRTWVD